MMSNGSLCPVACLLKNLKLLGKWIEPETILQCKAAQTQKGKCHLFSFTCVHWPQILRHVFMCQLNSPRSPWVLLMLELH